MTRKQARGGGPRTLGMALFGALSVSASFFATSAAACPEWSQQGTQLTYDAEQLWVPQSHSVVAGGSDNLSTCPQPGTGYVATRPDFDLNYIDLGMGRDLEFRVNASCDSVLLVNDARGQWHFDDDGGDGLNSRLRIPNAPGGAYDIWVGTYGPATCQATLTLETFNGSAVTPPQPPQPQGGCPNPGANGQMLTFDAQGLWTAQRFSVVAGGNLDLGACQTVPGHGHVIQNPDFTLNLTSNAPNYDLEFRVEGSCDPVLLVNDSVGQWHYNDDDNGLNSRVRISGARPGLFDVWVGTFGSQTCQATLIAETFPSSQPPQPPQPPQPALCPNPGANGQMLIYDATSLSLPQRFGVMAGGNVDLGACQSVPGHGHVVQNPDFTLELVSNPMGLPLALGIDGTCDPVLLVSDPNGQWHFDDDGGNGLNSRLELAGARPGQYDIWVGTFGSQSCEASLIVETLGNTPPPTPDVLPDPGNLVGYRDRVGQTFAFRVTGSASGSVWGTGIYTDDSTLARAAVHAGLLQVGQTGVVRVTILPGQQSYQGSTQNGVNSGNYGSWSGSYSFVRQPGGSVPGPVSARLIAVLPDAGSDRVGRGESMAPNGVPDAVFRFGVTAPGQTITSISVQNTSGPLSIWDTIPNGHWVGLAVVNGQIMNRGDTTVSIPLGAGETVIDFVVQQLENRVGRDGMRISIGFASGATADVIVPQNFSGQIGQPGMPSPAVEGRWNIVANGYAGWLDLDWTGSGWRGIVHFNVHGRDETLEAISFDAASGTLTFTRPIPGATQIYRGTLSNGQLQGQFNQGGGAYTYTWTATRPVGFEAPTTQQPGGQSRYELVVVPEGITFEAARQRAQAMGGHLATITSRDELDAVFAAANNPAGWFSEAGRFFIGPWLGGYRQGNQWMWITGEPWSFTAWSAGQPDNYQGRETHLNFWTRGSAPAPELNDADPNVPLRGFVVEFPPAGQAPQSGFFAEAWLNGERVDGCLYFGRNCGQPAADRFCQEMGFTAAAEGAYSHTMTDRTLVLGDGRICARPGGCGQLTNVTCVPGSGNGAGVQPPTGQAPAVPGAPGGLSK